MNITTSKGVKEIVCPNCWGAELFKPNEHNKKPIPTTTGHYQRFVKEWDGKDLVKLFSILTGIEYKTLSGTKDLALEESLLLATSYVYDTPQEFKDAPIPESLTINSRAIKIPKRIEGYSIGQSILVRQRIDEAKSYDELLSYAIAVYIQPVFDESDFDSDRANELEKEINLMPISQTYSLGFFLLKPLMRPGRNGSRIVNLLTTRCLRAFGKRGQIWLLPLLLSISSNPLNITI